MKTFNFIAVASRSILWMLVSTISLADLIIDERHHQEVDVITYPSTAIIYLNGKKLGESPLSIEIQQLAGLSNRITALPVFAHQFRQEVKLSKGSLPEHVKIFMDIDTRDRRQESNEQLMENEEPKPEKNLVTCNGHYKTHTLFFDTNDYRISESQRAYLEDFACHLLNEGSSPSINIYGHADPRGTEEYNIDLSLKRASSVKQLLIQFGYPAELIATFAYGETHLKDQGKTALPLEQNRRIYFELLYPVSDGAAKTDDMEIPIQPVL